MRRSRSEVRYRRSQLRDFKAGDEQHREQGGLKGPINLSP